MPSLLSLLVETKTQSPVVGVGCFSLVSSCLSWASRRSPRSSSRSSPRSSARPAYLSHMLCGPHRLIRSPRAPLLASSSRLSHRLIGSPLASYRPAPRLIDKRDGAERLAGAHRRAGGGCLLASDGGERMAASACLPRTAMGGGRSSTADGCGRRALAWLLACLGSRDGAARSFLDRSSFPLIVSSNRRGPGSFHHLIVSSTGRNLLSIFARPPPACSSRLACLGLFPRPRPGDAWAAAWLAAAGVRTVCLRSHPLCRSLAVARSLVAIRSVSIVPLVPALGAVGRFMGYSTRYLVGVGVFKYMPLNRILWILMGIFGDGVRCLFSALPVASFSPICPALRPLSAAVSWRWCGHVYAASLGKRRVCVLS